MVTIYLKKVPANNDIWLNDPTSSAPVVITIPEAPAVAAGGALGGYYEEGARARQLAEQIHEEDALLITIIAAFLETEENRWVA